jgi:predicted Zn finger-like uncharacterized protein
MPTTLQCPECSSTLRLAEEVAPGKKVRCPKCKAVFGAAEGEPPAAIQARPRTVPPSVKRPPSVLPADDFDDGPLRVRRRRRAPASGGGAGVLIAVLGGVGLLVVAGAALGAYFLLRSPLLAWQDFTPPGGNCTVAMPGTPQPKDIPISEPGVISSKGFAIETNRGRNAYLLAYADVTDAGFQRIPMTQRWQGMREGMLRNTPGASVTKESDVNLNGIPGREFVIDIPSKGGMGVLRGYFAKQKQYIRLYTLLAIGQDIRPGSADVQKFFDSFRLNEGQAPQGGGFAGNKPNPPAEQPPAPRKPDPNFPPGIPPQPGFPRPPLGPNFGGPQTGFGPEQTVTIIIHGIKDDANLKYDLGKLRGMLTGDRHSLNSQTSGGVTTVNLAPIDDPKAFADKLAWLGEVKSVTGRTITVNAKPQDIPPADADAIVKALFDLQSPDLFTRKDAAEALAAMKPSEKDHAKVAKALEENLDDENTFARQAKIKALGVWATKHSISALLKMMQHTDVFTRKAAISALGVTKDERAAEPLAEALTDFHQRGEAVEALKAIGPKAEKAVIKQLSNLEWTIRIEACKILEAIGTKECIAPLRDLALKDPNGISKQQAAKSAQIVAARIK